MLWDTGTRWHSRTRATCTPAPCTGWPRPTSSNPALVAVGSPRPSPASWVTLGPTVALAEGGGAAPLVPPPKPTPLPAGAEQGDGDVGGRQSDRDAERGGAGGLAGGDRDLGVLRPPQRHQAAGRALLERAALGEQRRGLDPRPGPEPGSHSGRGTPPGACRPGWAPSPCRSWWSFVPEGPWMP